jgi:hypothetical protein
VQITLGGVTLRDGIGQDATGAFVYLADHGRARRVEIGLEHDTGRDWVVSGVLAGNAVVTEGLVHVRLVDTTVGEVDDSVSLRAVCHYPRPKAQVSRVIPT